MGRDKALLPYRGQTFLSRLVYLALPRVDAVTVVLGHNAEAIAGEVPASPRVRVAVNEGYERGMLSSLQVGLQAAGEADWYLWMLVDHAAVRGRVLDRLLDGAAASSAPVVIPRFEGERGHPVVVSRALAEELLRLPRDCSPQDAVRRTYGQALFVDLDDSSVLVDVDRPEDYEALLAGGIPPALSP